MVALRVAISPKAERLRGERGAIDQLALLSNRRAASILAQNLDLHTQYGTLDLAAIDRLGRNPADKAAHDIGTARQGCQADIGFNLLVNIVEALVNQRRSGHPNRIQRGQIFGLFDAELCFGQRFKILGRYPKKAQSMPRRQPPKHARVWGKRRAVVEQQRRAKPQARHQPVPHHPAAGGEKEQPIALAQIVVVAMLNQLLEDDPGAVHDTLWLAGRPA